MAWVKVPPENHPVFRDCLPRDPRVSTVNMFGGVAAKVNGNIFAGLFGRSVIAKLSPADQKEAMALDGAAFFDPMGNGRVMHDTVHLPEAVMDEPDVLRSWLNRALAQAITRPPRAKKTASKTKKTPEAKKATKASTAASRPSRKPGRR